MKKYFVLIILFLSLYISPAFSEEITDKSDKEDKSTVSVKANDYYIEVIVSDIPQDQQTLFIPIKIDTMVLDFNKVVLEGIATQNILAVASTSKDKVGPGIGLIKFDEKGLPKDLTLKVLLKPVSDGVTPVSLLKVADEPALLSKGAVINDEIKASIDANEVEITEKIEKEKKKLTLSQSKVVLDVTRPEQKEETIFIPFVFDKSVVDLDETFGHAIIGPGISAKSFSSGSLHEGGPGVEIILTQDAQKDFSVDVDLIPKKAGTAKLVIAFPQKGHTSIVQGPQVTINPTLISVAKGIFSTAKSE